MKRYERACNSFVLGIFEKIVTILVILRFFENPLYEISDIHVIC